VDGLEMGIDTATSGRDRIDQEKGKENGRKVWQERKVVKERDGIGWENLQC